jgi:hypothetical protein
LRGGAEPLVTENHQTKRKLADGRGGVELRKQRRAENRLYRRA